MENQEQSRLQFESAVIERVGAMFPAGTTAEQLRSALLQRGPDGDYADRQRAGEWWAWKTSRAALQNYSQLAVATNAGATGSVSEMTELQMLMSWIRRKHPVTGKKAYGLNSVSIIRARARLEHLLKASEVQPGQKILLLENFDPKVHGNLARQGVPWHWSEDETLVDHWNCAAEPSAQMVAQRLGRDASAVISRICTLGLYRTAREAQQENMRRLKLRGFGVPVRGSKKDAI